MSQRQRLGTASAELEYAEYIQRRNKELAKNRPESKKSIRSSSSNSGRPNSRPGSKNNKTGDERKPYEL